MSTLTNIEYTGTVTDIHNVGDTYHVELDGEAGWHRVEGHNAEAARGQRITITYRRLHTEPNANGARKVLHDPVGAITIIALTDAQILTALDEGIASGAWTVFDPQSV